MCDVHRNVEPFLKYVDDPVDQKRANTNFRSGQKLRPEISEDVEISSDRNSH